MQYRRFGRTNLAVSVLTLGTRGLDARRWKDFDLAGAKAAMAHAFDSGVNAIAADPSWGEAEAIAGQVLREQRRQGDALVFAQVPPAVPFDLPAGHVYGQIAYPGSHIRAVTEASLRTLGVERLALQQLCVWTPEWLHEGDAIETLHRLREEGKIAAIGVSVFDHDPAAALEAVASGAIDCVQATYNLFDQGPAKALFPLCWKHGVAAIARSPLYAGGLTPRISAAEPFAPGDWRRVYFYDEHLAEVRERAASLAELVTAPDHDLAQMALRFALTSPAVSTVAVGMRTRAHVDANLAAVAGGLLTADRLEAVRSHKWLC